MKIVKNKKGYLPYLLIIAIVLFTIRPLWAVDKPSDKEISRAVETELLIQRGVYSDLIDVETHDGIITLKGTADNILEKERAAQVAKAVRGVEAVINQIEVKTPAVEDFTLQQHIKEALLKDPATDSYEVDVKADNGRVTLTGKVESWQEKDLAATVAKGVQGVKALDNKIDVVYTEHRTDFEIKRDIEEALKWDIYVNEGFIDVQVNNGNVKLKGTVGSAAEKDFAKYNAWVSGVKSVDMDNLKVDSWAEDKMIRDQKYTMKPDKDIEKAVEDAFMYDPRVFSFNPEVEVQNGTVSLSGSVDNLKAKRAAEEDAKNVVGVLRVRNFLKVRPVEAFSDKAVEQNVVWSLITDPYVKDMDVDVKVTNGVVSLFGNVNSYFEKIQAGDAASRTKGVIAVINNLEISQLSEVVSPTYSVPYYLYPWSGKADWEIKEDIQSQLWWSPFVDKDEVNVSIDDGHVKLTGTVDTWRERIAAEENAFEGGAITVNNQLKIENYPVY